MPTYTRGMKARKLTDGEIYRLYVEEKQDSDTVGAAAGCSSGTVLAIVRALGGAIRPPGGVRRNPVLRIPLEEIIRRYRDGQTGPKLAHIAGTTASTVYRMLRTAGVTIRPAPSGRGRRRSDGPD